MYPCSAATSTSVSKFERLWLRTSASRSEYARYTEHLGSRLTKRLHHLDAAVARGDEVLDDHHLLALLQATFYAVRTAVVLGAAAHVSHRQVEQRGRNGRMRDAGGAGTHQHLAFGIELLHHAGQPRLDVVAHPGSRERQPVVAVDRALDPARPGKGLLRPEEYRPYRKEVLGYQPFKFFQFNGSAGFAAAASGTLSVHFQSQIHRMSVF